MLNKYNNYLCFNSVALNLLGHVVQCNTPAVLGCVDVILIRYANTVSEVFSDGQ